MGKTQIVIIDDDHGMAAMMGEFLELQGYKVQTFQRAQGALDALLSSAEMVDLIICDIHMPEMNGFDFLQELRKTRPNLPVIMISAFGSVRTSRAVVEAGAHRYLDKPFKLSDLFEVVSKSLPA
jgi:DNA-binding NtrC family response regulator